MGDTFPAGDDLIGGPLGVVGSSFALESPLSLPSFELIGGVGGVDGESRNNSIYSSTLSTIHLTRLTQYKLSTRTNQC